MRRLALAAGLLLAVLLIPTTSADAICAKAVEWHATTYLFVPDTVRAPAAGRPLHGGTIPVCQDQVSDEPLPDIKGPRIVLFRVRGVSTDIAVRARDGLYVTSDCLAKLARGHSGQPGHVSLTKRCGNTLASTPG